MEKPHLLINWTDGVKINKDHFIESDFHTIEAMQDYATTHLTTYNYGLLAPHSGYSEPINLSLDIHTQESIVLRLKYCNAITKKGYRILYTSEMYGGDEPVVSPGIQGY